MLRPATPKNTVFAIAATPFTDHGAIDWPSLDKLIEFYLECGVHGLTILGMMGEAPKLGQNEAAQFIKHTAKRVNGRVPIVAGASAPGFQAMREISQTAMDAGIKAMMIQPPAPAAKGDDAVIRYCQQAARAIGDNTPWVLQDFPLASAVPMSAGTIKRIIDEIPSCCALKHEDWPGLDKLTALRGSQAPSRPLPIWCGNGGIFLPFELMRGADGAMTGFAYPEMLVQVCALFEQNRLDEMFDLFDAYLPLVRYEQQPGQGLLARKYVLKQRGIISCDAIRAPGGALSAQSRQEIDLLMSRLAQHHKTG